MSEVDFKLNTPVAFIIFNRPDTAQRVFNEIRKAKPTQLLVIADGPRTSRPGEDEKCKQTRAIIKQVDWDCKVLTNFSDVNLGCKVRVSSGLDWVFNEVEEAIILEDDCLPDSTFFKYCQELLEFYREDERIMMISGDNHLFGKKIIGDSYYFSQNAYIWGWASWRRAWNKYDVTMKIWPQVRDDKGLERIFDNKALRKYWTHIFEEVYHGKIDTWDYQWVFTCFLQKGLNVTPNRNLISNIGFGDGATHTLDDHAITANMAVEPMKFPLTHPQFLINDLEADKIVAQDIWKVKLDPKYKRMAKKIRNIINRLIHC